MSDILNNNIAKLIATTVLFFIFYSFVVDRMEIDNDEMNEVNKMVHAVNGTPYEVYFNNLLKEKSQDFIINKSEYKELTQSYLKWEVAKQTNRENQYIEEIKNIDEANPPELIYFFEGSSDSEKEKNMAIFMLVYCGIILVGVGFFIYSRSF